MPTPNATVLYIPGAMNVASLRQSCPPDDERLNADAEDSESNSGSTDAMQDSGESDGHSRSTPATTISETSNGEGADGKVRIAEDLAPLRDTPSPLSATEEGSDIDQRLVQSSVPRADSIALYPNGILGSPYPKIRFLPNSASSFLRPGARFSGTQQSDRQVYEVQVDLKHVDMNDSFLCGYLRIQGLTDDHPTLTTYFEGEIIGSNYTFLTKHPEWGASEKVDMAHWGRFPAWRPLAKQAKRSDFTFKNYAQRENIFMRWKEYFLVPDHRVRTISGASFEGFYYICFNQACGSISGIYFHAKSEKFQRLELKHVPDNGCLAAFEFR